MTTERQGELTELLGRLDEGAEVNDRLARLVYDELRGLARGRLGRRAHAGGLQATSLVHEAYVRLLGRDEPPRNRRHFFALAGRTMHDIIVEQARHDLALKRGGDRNRVPLADVAATDSSPADDILALSAALDRLRATDPLAADVVLLRHFAELTHEQVAEALDIPLIRARREWAYARASLRRRLMDGDGAAESSIDSELP